MAAVLITPPRPDLEAHRRSVTLPWPELVAALCEKLGRKLIAYIAGVRDVRAVDRWISGTEPNSGDTMGRLQLTFRIVETLTGHESPRVVQSWLTGLNPELGDRVPIRLLREGKIEVVGPDLLSAARAFVAGG